MAREVVSKFRQAGVKNVSYSLHQGRPSAFKVFQYQVLPTPNSHLLELRPDKAGEPKMRASRSGQNWGGQSAVDTSAVASVADNEDALVTGTANIATHEIAHDKLGPFYHETGATNLMNPSSHDEAWLFTPDLV